MLFVIEIESNEMENVVKSKQMKWKMLKWKMSKKAFRENPLFVFVTKLVINCVR